MTFENLRPAHGFFNRYFYTDKVAGCPITVYVTDDADDSRHISIAESEKFSDMLSAYKHYVNGNENISLVLCDNENTDCHCALIYDNQYATTNIGYECIVRYCSANAQWHIDYKVVHYKVVRVGKPLFPGYYKYELDETIQNVHLQLTNEMTADDIFKFIHYIEANFDY